MMMKMAMASIRSQTCLAKMVSLSKSSFKCVSNHSMNRSRRVFSDCKTVTVINVGVNPMRLKSLHRIHDTSPVLNQTTLSSRSPCNDASKSHSNFSTSRCIHHRADSAQTCSKASLSTRALPGNPDEATNGKSL